MIEHVGKWGNQKAFAREALRVGERYWIQTPNKNFPIESHFNDEQHVLRSFAIYS